MPDPDEITYDVGKRNWCDRRHRFERNQIEQLKIKTTSQKNNTIEIVDSLN